MKESVKNLKGTWKQALLTFFLPIFAVFFVRWFLVEPFVIPSGSMIPTLLIYDHILVNKLAFGMRVPGNKDMTVQWSHPQRGQIIVFKNPQNPEVFFVKRVVAVGGDTISVHEGVVYVNAQAIPQSKEPIRQDDRFDYFQESHYTVRYAAKDLSEFESFTVPEGHVFAMGDNRDQSSDSRVWGTVPENLLVGKAFVIWLSCDKTLVTAPFLCDPTEMRWKRFFTVISGA